LAKLPECIVRLQTSIRAYMVVVVYVASFVTFYKIGVWAVATYHP
jgi:hypothetical protein